jgi:hypothetical protein
MTGWISGFRENTGGNLGSTIEMCSWIAEKVPVLEIEPLPVHRPTVVLDSVESGRRNERHDGDRYSSDLGESVLLSR